MSANNSRYTGTEPLERPWASQVDPDAATVLLTEFMQYLDTKESHNEVNGVQNHDLICEFLMEYYPEMLDGAKGDG